MIINQLQWLYIKLYMRLFVPGKYKMQTPDRAFLEQNVLRLIVTNFKQAQILFVGVHKHSSWYATLFNKFTSNKFYSIDLSYDYADSIYSTPYHTVENFLDFKPGRKFDIVLFNGVYGYGINDLAEQMQSVRKLNAILNQRGYLILGFRKQTLVEKDISDIHQAALSALYDDFDEITFCGSLSSNQVINPDNFHRIVFMQKKCA